MIVAGLPFIMARQTNIFALGPIFSEKNGPGGPFLLKYWSPGPIVSPDQNFRDSHLFTVVPPPGRQQGSFLIMIDTQRLLLRRGGAGSFSCRPTLQKFFTHCVRGVSSTCNTGTPLEGVYISAHGSYSSSPRVQVQLHSICRCYGKCLAPVER